jgi:hypothetical protein
LVGSIENKDLFVDVRRNSGGVYLKLSERRNGSAKKTILIPASGLSKLQAVLEEVSAVVATNSTTKKDGKKPSPPAG